MNRQEIEAMKWQIENEAMPRFSFWPEKNSLQVICTALRRITENNSVYAQVKRTS